MSWRVAVTYNEERKLGPYAAAAEAAGLEPVPLSPSQPAGMDGLAGLVLTGGTDVDPARYGQAPLDANDEPDRYRDALETALVEEALEADLPILAICRGLQMLNVVRGGTLLQDIPNHRHKGIADAHEVTIAPGSKLAAILNAVAVPVNSRHHQAADRIGDGLTVTATATDGVVEGLEMPGRRFVVAVQWHPEDRIRTHAVDRKLFDAFAAAVRA